MNCWFRVVLTEAAYVVFPGNVGTDDTLRDLVASWAKSDASTEMQYQRYGRSRTFSRMTDIRS